MKKTLISIAILAASPMLAQADTLAGVYAGAQYWDMQADGAFGSNNRLQEYDLKDEGKGSVWIAIEHPVPLLPNVKLRYNQMDTDGSADVVDFSFGGRTFNGASTVDAELDHFDGIFYYEILDNDLVAIDLGVNVKYGDFKVDITGEVSESGGGTATVTTREDYKGVIPMLYGAAEVGIPTTGLSVYAEANWVGFDDYNAYDVQAGAQYLFIDNLAVEMGLQVGYRKIMIDVEDLSNLYIDADFDGAYAGLMVHF